MAAAYVRRKHLVDVRYQIKFVTKVFLAVLIVALASALLVCALLWTNMYRPDEGPPFVLAASFIAVALTLLTELLLAIPIVFVLGIRQSHRIVGPMKRIAQALEAIGSGDFSQRLVLRRGDALEDLAGAINRMAERLRQRLPPSSGS